MKIIMRKKDKIVKYDYPDDADIKFRKDSMGNSIIRIANYPPARIEGKTTYLGGRVICDHDFVDDADVIENVDNVPSDIKDKIYIYDKNTGTFTKLLLVPPE